MKIIDMITDAVSANYSSNWQTLEPLFRDGSVSLKIIMTPKIAKRLLDSNKSLLKLKPNRKLSGVYMRRWAKMMEGGKWLYNGDTIVISTKETLLDGQHRLESYLMACEDVGVEKVNFETLLVLNVDEKAFITIDAGKPRSVADDNSIEGLSGSEDFSWAQHKIFLYEECKWGRNGRLDRIKAEEIRQKHPFLKDSFKFVKDKCELYKPTVDVDKKTSHTKKDIFIAFHYICPPHHKSRIEEFIDNFFNPNYQQSQCPISAAKTAWRSAIEDPTGQSNSGFIRLLLTYSLNLFMRKNRVIPKEFDELRKRKFEDLSDTHRIPFSEYGLLEQDVDHIPED